jgi:hypothetical protein
MLRNADILKRENRCYSLPVSNINHNGSIKNRTRFTIDVATAIAEKIGARKRVIRTRFSLFVFPDR